jgi:hypothetical protein
MIASEYFSRFQFQSSQSSRETFCETNSQNDRWRRIAPKQKALIKYDVIGGFGLRTREDRLTLGTAVKQGVSGIREGVLEFTRLAAESCRLSREGAGSQPAGPNGQTHEMTTAERHPQWCYGCLRSNSSLR